MIAMQSGEHAHAESILYTWAVYKMRAYNCMHKGQEYRPVRSRIPAAVGNGKDVAVCPAQALAGVYGEKGS